MCAARAPCVSDAHARVCVFSIPTQVVDSDGEIPDAAGIKPMHLRAKLRELVIKLAATPEGTADKDLAALVAGSPCLQAD